MHDLADPDTIHNQKDTYAKDLEEQLKKGIDALSAAHRQQTDALHNAANQEKTRYNLALDQQVKQHELFLSQEYNEQLMRLQQAAQAKRAELETQATTLTLEFQQRKVQEEFLAQQIGIQQQHAEAQRKIDEEFQKLGVAKLPQQEATVASASPVVSAPSMVQPLQVQSGQVPTMTVSSPLLQSGQVPPTMTASPVVHMPSHPNVTCQSYAPLTTPSMQSPMTTNSMPAPSLVHRGVANAPTFISPVRTSQSVAIPQTVIVPQEPLENFRARSVATTPAQVSLAGSPRHSLSHQRFR